MSTDSTASSRPVYASDSTTWRATTWLTVTFGGGGVTACGGWQAVSRNTSPIRGSCHTRFNTILLTAGAAHKYVRRPSALTMAPHHCSRRSRDRDGASDRLHMFTMALLALVAALRRTRRAGPCP